MTVVRDIRDLAQRAELEFHQRPHPFRRQAWMAGLILSAICLAWVGFSGFRGNHRLYEAGTVSQAHAFIANDCRQCHTTWQPVDRLLSLDADEYSSRHASVDNQACLKCHTASEHHPNQIPAHADLSCAACHREHQGRQVLAQVSDQQCIHCHADLKTTDETESRFAQHVTGFDAAHGHPEFHLWRRLASSAADQTSANLISDKEQQQDNRPFFDVLRPLQPGESGLKDSASGLRDRTELKFNHATHFQDERIVDRDGRREDLAKNCQACHEPETDGRYIRPVRFDAHCARCHPLWYDNDNFPDAEVPHARMEIVRGFLTERYTLAALRAEAPLQERFIPRPLPGSANRPALTAAQAHDVERRVARAEKFVLTHTHRQTQGGCQFCHTFEQKSLGEPLEVVPPAQPERWLIHSRFDHTAHRMFDCLKCHQDVTSSRPERESQTHVAAADVLLPRIKDCQACHVSPKYRSSSASVAPSASIETIPPVSSSCVMCHTYHRRESVSDKLP